MLNNNLHKSEQKKHKKNKATFTNFAFFLKRTCRNFWNIFIKTFGVLFSITTFVFLLSLFWQSFSNVIDFQGYSYKFNSLYVVQKNKDSKTGKTQYFFKDTDITLPTDTKEKYIAVVNFEGTIMPQCLQANDICPQVALPLFKYLKNSKHVIGVIIKVNSPGGEAYSSEELYQAIKAITLKKPVYVFVAPEAASGAYYATVGANKIYASNMALVGSIGVYADFYNYDGLLSKLGIRHKYILSSHAQYKLLDQLLFAKNDKQKIASKQLQDIVDSAEKSFFSRVTQNRKNVKINNLHGLIFTAEQAQQNGLIDGIAPDLQFVIYRLLQDNKINYKKVNVVEFNANSTGVAGVNFALNKIISLNTRYSNLLIMLK